MRLDDLSLTECLFFLGHDLFTGRIRIRREMLDIGLAGAVLVDLTLDSRVTVNAGVVHVTSRYATGDPVSDWALRLVMNEQDEHPVRDWIEYLRAGAFDSVVGELTRRKQVVAATTRGLFRRTTNYEASDLRSASAPRTKVRAAMMGRAQPDQPIATLALLAWSIGLDNICEPDLPHNRAQEWVEQHFSLLMPPLNATVSAVEAAVATAVYGGARG